MLENDRPKVPQVKLAPESLSLVERQSKLRFANTKGSPRDVQLDLKVLWDGHLARPNLGGQDAHPTRDQGFRKRVAHRVSP